MRAVCRDGKEQLIQGWFVIHSHGGSGVHKRRLKHSIQVSY